MQLDDEWITLSIEDDGDGVHDDYKEKVFDLFTTLRARDEVEGSGMGLALVRRVVRRQGGAVWIEDASGGGARVVVRWPKTPKDVQ